MKLQRKRIQVVSKSRIVTSKKKNYVVVSSSKLHKMGSFSCSVYITLVLGFPTGRDSLVSRDKGTEVSSLSRDKETTGQGQNLFMRRAGTGF